MFLVKLPNCTHSLCTRCCSNIYNGYLNNRFINEKTCLFPEIETPKFPVKYQENKDEYFQWFEANDEPDDNEWYRREFTKYKKRQTRPSWMNHEQMIEFEDRYIQYCIIDNFNSNAREDIINIKEEQATNKCPFCRKS